jgi:hypothetical protein
LLSFFYITTDYSILKSYYIYKMQGYYPGKVVKTGKIAYWYIDLPFTYGGSQGSIQFIIDTGSARYLSLSP